MARDADSTVLLQYEGGLTVLLMPSWNWPVNRKDIIVKPYYLASLENNMIVVKILDAAIRSAKSGKAIFFLLCVVTEKLPAAICSVVRFSIVCQSKRIYDSSDSGIRIFLSVVVCQVLVKCSLVLPVAGRSQIRVK